jgi:3-keto-disaccharide hydrolase
MRTRNIAATVAVLTACVGGVLSGQQPGGRPATGSGQAGRGGPRGPEPLPFEDHAGFVSIFDGSTLKGWDADTKFWRAEGGAIVGQTTADNPLKENSFVIWRGGEPADFELKVEYRINATNSGIQIRSVRLPPGTQQGRGAVAGNWVLKGYQCDIDAENRFTGQIYEERGRGFLAMRGQFAYIPEGGGPKVVGALQRSGDELLKVIKVNDWNQAHVIARGNMITEILNGHVTSTLVDDDTKARALKGLLGFQIHVGEPMKVEFKNIWLKQY